MRVHILRLFYWPVVFTMLAGMLAGCARSEDKSPTAAFANNPAPNPASQPKPVATLAIPTFVSALPSPTPAPISPTVTPLSTPSPLSTSGPVTTIAAQVGDSASDQLGDVDSAAQSNPVTYNVKDLPRRNNLPVLPLINPAPARATAQPPLKENYGANGQPKVAIQAGHWMINQLPDELASLRTQTGGAGGGVREVDYVLDLSKQVVKLLQDKGIEAELLPATVPVDYTADAFVALHADAVDGGGPGGYKLARSRFSAIPATDDALMNALYDAYGKATGLRRDSNITRNMTGYYAFNNRRHVHGITRATPGVILETGYLTNASDRAYLTTHQDEIAQGIVDGIMDFLNNRPPLELREKAATTVPAVEVKQDNTVVLAQPDGAPLAYVAKGQRFEFFDTRGDYYSVRLPVLNKTGFLAKADVSQTTLPR